MLPTLGGEGSKSQKSGSFIGKLFGRQNSTKEESESPRNSTNRAGSGSINAVSPGKQWALDPRQAGATATTGKAQNDKPLLNSAMFGAKSRKVLFTEGADDSDDSMEGKAGIVFDHNQAFKRSHTVNDIGSVSSSAKTFAGSPKPLSTATALANVGEKTNAAQDNSLSSLANNRVSIAAALNIPVGDLAGKSQEELKKMLFALQQEARQLKTDLAEIKEKQRSGSGSGARASVILADFNEPKHQMRPSLIAQNIEAIKLGSASTRTSRVSYAPGTGGLEEEDSGFIEDEAESKPKVKPANAYETIQAEERKKEEAARKQREREAAEAAAAKAAAEKKAAAEAQQKQPTSSGSTAPKRKYKLLSVYPLLPPNMRREEWSISNFKIEKKLHAGYASEVYRVTDTVSKEILAVKVYNLNALGELNKVQLIREIRLHGNFTHRNIIELYVAFQEEHRVILAQRYAEGGDLLRALHKAGGRLTEKSAVQMVIHPLLNCLVYLHAKGITHRDIKPENILFDGEGVLKLADFGLAINMTEENAVTRAGTLHYMAPEVVKNPLKDHPNDFKNDTRYHYNSVVDSWAVGCLAYELIVGFPPFMADTQQQVVKNINTKEVQYTKKMSDEMISFCKAALQRDPSDRATATDLMKHPWILMHMRRNSSRQLNFEAQPGHMRVVADFATGTAVAKAHNAAHRAADHGPGKSKEGSKMAPF